MPMFHTTSRPLFYREQGHGPLLLLLPGNTASSASYHSDIAHFSQHHRVVALDFWGTGQSGRETPWPLDWWEHNARDAVALLDHLHEPSCLVMGSSGGAIVALLLTLHAPDRVRAVIADSGAAVLSPEHLRTIVAGREPTPATEAFWRHAHGDDWADVVAADSAWLLRLAEQGGYVLDPERLHQMTCPVLFTASLGDTAIPDLSEQVVMMARQIPASQGFLFNAGGHPLMWHCPGQFRAVVQQFLHQLEEEV